MAHSAEQGTSSPTPRKYNIRSNFGNARQPRSRKNRPCDACRRRKTACIIASEPPCLFCKSRGLVCRSLPDTDTRAHRSRPQSTKSADHLSPASISVSASSTSIESPSVSETTRHRPQSAAVVHNGLAHLPTPVSAEGLLENTLGLDVTRLGHDQEALYALEDVPGRTALAMALASEQDPYFLDAFRSVLLSEREGIDANFIQVSRERQNQDYYPMNFMLLLNEFPEHRNEARQVASDAIEGIVWPHGPALIRLYFRHVHAAFPVIHKARFLQEYATAQLDIPSSLRGAVYALASVFWSRDASLAGTPCPFKQHELINHAQEALRRELEAPNLSKLMAALLLMHMVPPEMDSVETPYLRVMACQATATAQMLGLHQGSENWNIAPWEKKLRKKLWWAVFYTDCWSAVSHGNPPQISDESFTTRPLEMDDLRSGEDINDDINYMIDPEDTTFRVSDGARFLEMIKVSREMRFILDSSYGVKSTVQTRTGLLPIREKLKEWLSFIPVCLAMGPYARNGSLHMSFFATQVLLFRGLMHPATRTAKATPGSGLRRWLPTALAEFEQFIVFMDHITEEELTSFWGRFARSQLILCGNFLIYLFLLASEAPDIEVAYRLLEKFHQSLQRLGATDDAAAKAFLRPAILRTESFFMQATELIQHGKTVVLEPPVITAQRGE